MYSTLKPCYKICAQYSYSKLTVDEMHKKRKETGVYLPEFVMKRKHFPERLLHCRGHRNATLHPILCKRLMINICNTGNTALLPAKVCGQCEDLIEDRDGFSSSALPLVNCEQSLFCSRIHGGKRDYSQSSSDHVLFLIS